MMRHSSGSVPSAPSDLYLRVVKGEVPAKTYVAKVKKLVDRQIAKNQPGRRAAGA